MTATDFRPTILLNFADSLDGKIHPVPARRPAEGFVMSRGREDFRRMREVRERADAILIGASNLRVDDPGLSLSPVERERRRGVGERLPARVVVTTNGEGIEAGAKMFQAELGGPGYVVHAASMPQPTRRALSAVAELVELGDESVSIERLLLWLKRDLGANTVLCEGGGVLVAQLFVARAVDELYLTLVPRILGGTSAPTLVAGEGFGVDQIPDARLRSCETIGSELYLRYTFDWA